MSNIKNKLDIIFKKKWMKFTAVVLCLVFGGIHLSSAQAQDTAIASDYTVLHMNSGTHLLTLSLKI